MTSQMCSGAAATPARVLSVCCWIALSMLSCKPDHSVSEEDGVGRAMFALREVPADVMCVRITAVTGARSVSRDFDVTPGATEALQLNGLPLGLAKFYGEAFQTPCSELGANPVSQWSSSAVDVTVAQGAPVPVNLVLRRSGAGAVNVDFQDTDLPPSSVEECTSGQTQQQPCGSCGTQERSCADTGLWAEWGTCVNQGECPPEATETCGSGGVRTCTAECTWSECVTQACPGVRQCEPGQVGNCVGTGIRRCDDACTWGECQCSSGMTACGDGCFDLTVNSMHCGTCSNACEATTELCAAGTCFVDVP
jgi:hypothetical protein